MKITITDEDGDDIEHELPHINEVCSTCHGEGKTVNPSIDGNGITVSEWSEDWDEDSREAYFSGKYDVVCRTCNGNRVIQGVDEEHLSPKQIELYIRWMKQQHEYARCDDEDRQTKRMENGGYG